ncbi:DNA-binding domain-containing protein [Mesorhizobium sp. LHD-90]|uniref:HvfC/BufC N-terminal domain-containing protein n=1 Tax=Mesorhizobium sp. LHD-90 TaxID=3071414 RepID=UPI0027E138B8|nr:DNA-binding domain-containing protein [Mesorhizobium sp. LHD-90]MDQ6436134.1 DNA-binding domain-containing protein [Mesorhizobium sp. LHD-90]
MDIIAIQNAFAAALVDPGQPAPAGITTARGKPDEKRFAVYRNNVAVGLTRALESRFPVTRQLVGADFFAGMARAFIAGHKPASPLIFAYGGDFPDFVAGFAPAAGLPYLADVARLEAAWTHAYHAADAVPLAIATLAGLDGERLAVARLTVHPAAALLRSCFPTGSIWQAHQGDIAGSASFSGGECVLVTRPEFDVRVHVLPPRDAPFAEALFGGLTLGEAAERTAAEPEFDFGAALVGLIGLGAFAGVRMEGG